MKTQLFHKRCAKYQVIGSLFFRVVIVDTLYFMNIMAIVIRVTSLYPIYIIMCSACWYVSPSVCKSVGTFDCWYVGKLVRW